MLGKIALEECWSIPESVTNYNPLRLAPKRVIGGDLIANLLDVHGHGLQQMNQNGADMMVLSLSSPGAQGFSNPAEAKMLASLANDRLEEEIMKNTTRLAGVVALSMHDPAQAAAELKHCMTEKRASLVSCSMTSRAVDRMEIRCCSTISRSMTPFGNCGRAATPLIHEQMER